MKYSQLSEICAYINERIAISELSKENYISTENMISNKGGISISAGLPSFGQTQSYSRGDILISNIRPYFKKIWLAAFNVNFREFLHSRLKAV